MNWLVVVNAAKLTFMPSVKPEFAKADGSIRTDIQAMYYFICIATSIKISGQISI